MKPLTTNSIRIVSLVLMAMWLGGCSGLNHAVLNGPIPQGRSIVFGSISMGSALSHWVGDRNVTVINTRNSETVLAHKIEGLGGSFYWYLPPGQYAIFDLTFHSTWTHEISSHRIYAEFSIDSEQKVIYVGTLGLASLHPSITDDFDTAVQAFCTNFPALNNIVPVKQLLHLEEAR